MSEFSKIKKVEIKKFKAEGHTKDRPADILGFELSSNTDIIELDD